MCFTAAEGAIVFLTVDWNGASEGCIGENVNTHNTLVNMALLYSYKIYCINTSTVLCL